MTGRGAAARPRECGYEIDAETLRLDSGRDCRRYRDPI